MDIVFYIIVTTYCLISSVVICCKRNEIFNLEHIFEKSKKGILLFFFFSVAYLLFSEQLTYIDIFYAALIFFATHFFSFFVLFLLSGKNSREET